MAMFSATVKYSKERLKQALVDADFYDLNVVVRPIKLCSGSDYFRF